MDKQLFTIPEFSQVYALSRSAIYREIQDGRLNLTKVGRRSYIARADAEDWLRALPRSTRRAG